MKISFNGKAATRTTLKARVRRDAAPPARAPSGARAFWHALLPHGQNQKNAAARGRRTPGRATTGLQA